MATDAGRLVEMKAKLQKLANEVHAAKRDLDWHQYDWTGFDDPQIRRRTLRNWRDFPDNFVKRQIEAKAKVYRQARREWMAAKAGLDESHEASDKQAETSAIKGARDAMVAKSKATLADAVNSSKLRDTTFELKNHPKLVDAISQSVREVVKQMQREPSIPNILAVVETLAGGIEMGFELVRPDEHKVASEAAKRTAIKLRDDLAKRAGPRSSKLQAKRLLRLTMLVHYL